MLAILDTGLDTTQRVESPCGVHQGAGVQQLLVPGVAVGAFIARRCVANGVEITCSVISATQESFSEDEGVEF